MRVPFLQVSVTASCQIKSPLTVGQITVKHSGLGASQDLSGVYALSRAVRVSSVLPINAHDQTVNLRLRSFSVPPCQSRTLTIVADIAAEAAASSEHVFSLQSLLAQSGGTAAAVQIKTGTEQLPPTGIAPTGVDPPALEFRTLTQRIVYGTARSVSRFLLTGGKDDLLIDAITFHNSGSAKDEDLQNFTIQDAKHDTLTNVTASLSGSDVRLTFNPPLRLERSMELLLDLKADVRSSIRRTVHFGLDEATDIEWEKAGR